MAVSKKALVLLAVAWHGNCYDDARLRGATRTKEAVSRGAVSFLQAVSSQVLTEEQSNEIQTLYAGMEESILENLPVLDDSSEEKKKNILLLGIEAWETLKTWRDREKNVFTDFLYRQHYRDFIGSKKELHLAIRCAAWRDAMKKVVPQQFEADFDKIDFDFQDVLVHQKEAFIQDDSQCTNAPNCDIKNCFDHDAIAHMWEISTAFTSFVSERIRMEPDYAIDVQTFVSLPNLLGFLFSPEPAKLRADALKRIVQVDAGLTGVPRPSATRQKVAAHLKENAGS